MTSVEAHPPHSSPWLSVWFKPRKTIERIIAVNPRRHVLLLAWLSATAAVVSGLIQVGVANELFAWRNIAIVAIVGLAYGVTSLYLNGFLYMWSGRILRG